MKTQPKLPFNCIVTAEAFTKQVLLAAAMN
jgi:hypothetical protein